MSGNDKKQSSSLGGKIFGAIFILLFVFGTLVFGLVPMIKDSLPQFTDLLSGDLFSKIADHQHNGGMFILCLICLTVICIPGVFSVMSAKRNGWPKNNATSVNILIGLCFVLGLPLWVMLFYWLNAVWFGSGGESIFIIGGLGFYGSSILGAIIKYLGLFLVTACIAFLPASCFTQYIIHKSETKNNAK